MKIDSLTSCQFRNLEETYIEFDPELTVLCGKNGQGKTNLLESVWMLTGGKSFRMTQDSQLIRMDAQTPFAALEAVVRSSGHTARIRVLIDKKAQKGRVRTMFVNGAACENTYEAAGVFTAAVFEPNMMKLIKGGPAERRRFVDSAVCQVTPQYARILREYYGILSQKNALLKRFRWERDEDHSLMDVYDEHLLKTGLVIRNHRRRMLDLILPEAQRTYRDISGEKEALTYRYEMDLTGCEEQEPQTRGQQEALAKTAPEALLSQLRENRYHDVKLGYCTYGPHRDDFSISIDGRQARHFASQGQQRSAVLALILGEAHALYQESGEYPVMLLDDVFSELDGERQKYLLSRLSGRQTILTSCTEDGTARTGGKVIHVERGRVWE